MIINNDVKKRFYKYCDMDMQWTGSKNTGGYGKMWVNGKMEQAHRVSYEIHNGPIPDGMCVLHSCDIKICCNPFHLHLGTNADNSREMTERGRCTDNSGEKNGKSKLTEEQVIGIREKHKNGIRQSVLSREYGVDPSAISLLVNRKRWKSLRCN